MPTQRIITHLFRLIRTTRACSVPTSASDSSHSSWLSRMVCNTKRSLASVLRRGGKKAEWRPKYSDVKFNLLEPRTQNLSLKEFQRRYAKWDKQVFYSPQHGKEETDITTNLLSSPRSTTPRTPRTILLHTFSKAYRSFQQMKRDQSKKKS